MSEVIPEPEPNQPEDPGGQPAAGGWLDGLIEVAIRLGLILAILAVYFQVRHFEFLAFDDPHYVYENPHVIVGLTSESIKWAWTAVAVANWMPITLLSHMLDCELFGLASGMHHLTNVMLHIMASLLLFGALRRATGARGASAFVAFVFGLHPLHVESVAWVSERKDVLSACFFFLALYAYVRYTESPNLRRYLLVVVIFCLGLMTKPMLVTFPFALLLFDFWPLRRVQLRRILWEKGPFIALSAGACVVTYFAQRSFGAFPAISFGRRVENALVSYVVYIGKMFWPTRLAVFYPFPDSTPAWQVAGALGILVGISALAIYTRKTRPYFVTGWFWYLGMLVPVIGLVQVGLQSHADRYMYLPMVGLLWILAWGALDVLNRWPRAKPVIAMAAGVCCVACLMVARTQTALWQNGVILFQNAYDITGSNDESRLNLAAAHNYVGFEFSKIPGHYMDARSHFEAALRLCPDLWQANQNMGLLLSEIPGRQAEAVTYLETAQRLRKDPKSQDLIDHLKAAE